MAAKILVFLLLIVSVVHLKKSGRILVYVPTPSISHQVVFRPLTQELAKRGHEVTVVTTDPAFHKGQTPANLTEVDVRNVSYELWRENIVSMINGNAARHIDMFRALFHNINIIFEKQIKTKELKEILGKSKDYYDLLILEGCFRQTLVLSHLFEAPVIQMNSLGAAFDNYEIIGAATHPFLYPKITYQRLYNLTMWEKISELYKNYLIIKLYKDFEKEENEMLRKHFGDDVPSLSALANNVQMFFVNVHPIFEGNIPVPPSVVHIGGIHKMPEKELPKDLKTYMDSSKHGIIYMSFGTNTDPTLLPPEKIQLFMRVFSKMPYDIILKWTGDKLPGKTENIRIGKWFPQSDLLKHPKLKLFVTQGGLQSTDEAIDAGVPLIGIPMLGDQWYNTEKYVHLKIGVQLDVTSLTDEQFRRAIETVIGDASYRENIVRLRTLTRDQPQQPLERAVWWTEYVLRHGGASHLRAPAANMPWTRYYEIELVLTLLTVFFVTFFSCLLIIFKIYSYVRKYFFAKSKSKVKLN